jgi:tRNA dimethylallyltransferase
VENKGPLLCLAGPTASGKTALSFELADRYHSELISVDSALVFRSMDIGTAKPTPIERKQMPHHLIDVVDPSEHYSVARFLSESKLSISHIRQKHKLPIMVGGTMLYFKALIEGLAELPDRDNAIRMAIEIEATEIGWAALHAKLLSLDPITATKIDKNDTQRIQRALEVIKLTGKPVSESLDAQKSTGKDTEILALFPSDRSWLHHRIEQRFDIMIKSGFLDEVRGLMDRGDLDESLPSIRCVGYRQAWGYLRGEYDYDDFRQKSLAATRQLAKRQLTWLRNWKGKIKYFDPLDACMNKKFMVYISSKNLNAYEK